MFNLTLKAAKVNFFDRKAVLNAVDKATRKVLSKFGAFVRTRARSSIRRRKKASEPGEPPSSHVGLLKSFIMFAYEAARQSVVIGPTKLNRPGKAPEALEYGGESEIVTRVRGKKRRRRVRIRARPYMRPAFETEKSKLPALWANSVK